MEENERISKNERLFLFIAIFAGIILRFLNYPAQAIWIDETWTARYASGKDLIYIFWDVFSRDMHPPVFYMIEHLFCSVFGYSEASLRFLPVVFGIINIFIIYKMTRTYFSEKVALTATTLFALNPYQIYYSQEARSYTLFLMTSLLMVHYFLVSIKYNQFLFRPFVFWSVAAVYTRSYGVMLLIILNLILLLKYKDEIRLNLWFKANGLILLCMLPLLIFYLKGALGEQYSNNTGILLAPLYTLKNYIFGMTLDINIIVVLGFLAVLYILLMAVFTRRYSSNEKLVDIMAWICLLFILIPWLISLAGKPVYSERTFILVSALILILLAVGASYLARNGVIVFTAIMLIFNSVALYNYYFVEKYQKINYRDQYALVASEYKEGDVIIHTGTASYYSFEFYDRFMFKTDYENRVLGEIPEFKGSGLRFKIRELWRGWKELMAKKFGLEIYAGYDKNILTPEELKTNIPNYKRVWLVRDNETGIKQVYLPMGHIWNSGRLNPKEYGEAPELDGLKWVKQNYTVDKTLKFFADDIFVLKKK